MKKIKNSFLIIIMAILILMMFLYSKVEAAGSFSATASTNLQPNETTKLSVSTTGCAGKFSIKSSNPNVISISSSSTFVDGKSMTPEITLTAKSEGTATITITAVDVLDPSYNEVTGSKNIIITVKSSSTTGNGNTGSNQGGNTGNNGGSTTNKPTVTEPKFTSTNKTVYATSDINLRSSWSTSSSATKIAKGTELKLTGTSTEKVNGYVWYRVTYNGQTKYVSKDLITENKPEEKANNNLKILKIEGVELTPEFNANVTEYSIQLTNYKENELKILAEAEDNKSTVKIEGNTNLKLGENVITITVTAEDGTKKVYTITATKEDKEALGLKSLVIKDVELKDFSTDKFEYEIEFEALEKLDIEAIPNMEGATVEILGNENLVDGENTITIIVTSADGEQTATYQIKANRLIQSKQEENRELNIKSLLICGLIALVVLVIIIILIIKYVKNNDNSNIDYVYNDNLNNEQNENNSQDNEHAKEEEIEENEKKQEEIQVEETSNQVRKSKVDELFDNYEEETQKKKGRGKHSK